MGYEFSWDKKDLEAQIKKGSITINEHE